ncbi:hypothetical protein [Kribbella deserti]|uniref:Uncharacterized protein n=1 Tax=Kribbella deserti TaxID=1926257 RepID=A0ABV6QSV7_9ACTN
MDLRDGWFRRTAWRLPHDLARALGSPAARVAARWIAFEPAFDCLRKLKAAAIANDLMTLLEVAPMALGDRPEMAELRADSRYDVADAGVRSLHGDGAIVQRVPVVRLDDRADKHGYQHTGQVLDHNALFRPDHHHT